MVDRIGDVQGRYKNNSKLILTKYSNILGDEELVLIRES